MDSCKNFTLTIKDVNYEIETIKHRQPEATMIGEHVLCVFNAPVTFDISRFSPCNVIGREWH